MCGVLKYINDLTDLASDPSYKTVIYYYDGTSVIPSTKFIAYVDISPIRFFQYAFRSLSIHTFLRTEIKLPFNVGASQKGLCIYGIPEHEIPYRSLISWNTFHGMMSASREKYELETCITNESEYKMVEKAIQILLDKPNLCPDIQYKLLVFLSTMVSFYHNFDLNGSILHIDQLIIDKLGEFFQSYPNTIDQLTSKQIYL